jgi:predicted phage-related endonuclease
MLNDICEVAYENAADLADNNQDKFREIRRMGLGASDSSVILGVNPFPDNTVAELTRQKISNVATETEKKIGKMVNVRKGIDLEPLILSKFEKKFGIEVDKPQDMYRITEFAFLTVNYDGLTKDEPEVPVEVKFISKYGAKYYDFGRVIQPGQEPLAIASQENITKQYIKDMAKKTGVPVYYYTQVQQQLLGTGADYAYLVGLKDTDWKLYVWKIIRDSRTIESLIVKGGQFWQRVDQLKNG